MEQQHSHPLDQYLQDHKAQLDVEIPGGDVWKKIESRLDGRTIPLWHRLPLWRAAAVVLMLLVGGAALWQLRPDIQVKPEDSVAAVPEMTIKFQENWEQREAQYQLTTDSLLQAIRQYELYQYPDAERHMQHVHQLNEKIAAVHEARPVNQHTYDNLTELYLDKIGLLRSILDNLQADSQIP